MMQVYLLKYIKIKEDVTSNFLRIDFYYKYKFMHLSIHWEGINNKEYIFQKFIKYPITKNMPKIQVSII